MIDQGYSQRRRMPESTASLSSTVFCDVVELFSHHQLLEGDLSMFCYFMRICALYVRPQVMDAASRDLLGNDLRHSAPDGVILLRDSFAYKRICSTSITIPSLMCFSY